MHPFTNPVVRGFHPDPSVCRVGEDYYLVCSTFAWFPVVPVMHSTDLVDWDVVGHVVDDAAGLERMAAAGADLSNAEASDGVWAPTIRHHDGVFYVVFATARDRRAEATLLFTATDPRGPWAGPVRLEADGIDPSLFFDADGTCWFHAARDRTSPTATGPGEIYVRRLDLTTLRLTGAETIVWHGALTGAWVEAPHLYAHDGRYLMLAAEGGTERNHSVVAATADHPEGPWRTDPRSPLLSHRHLDPLEEFQDIGHADLVEGPDGRTWATLLGVRRLAGHVTTGREVFLAPVDWTEHGPVFAEGTGAVPRSVDACLGAHTSPRTVVPSPVPLTDRWFSSLRGPLSRAATDDGARLLRASPIGWDAGQGTPAFLGFAQRDHCFEAVLEFSVDELSPGDRVGMVVLNTTHAVVTVALTASPDGRRRIGLEHAGRELARTTAGTATPGARTLVRVQGDEQGYVFSTSTAISSTTTGPAAGWDLLGSVERATLSTETAGGFLGVQIGPFALGATSTTVLVHRFDYSAAALDQNSTGTDEVPLPGARQPALELLA